jgi:hypothetical protein
LVNGNVLIFDAKMVVLDRGCKAGRREDDGHAECAAGAFLTPVAMTDVRRERFFRAPVAKAAAIAPANRRYGEVHGQSSQKPTTP